MELELPTRKSKRSKKVTKKPKGKISFEENTISRDLAKKLISEEAHLKETHDNEPIKITKQKRKKASNTELISTEPSVGNPDAHQTNLKNSNKKRKSQELKNDNSLNSTEEQLQTDSTTAPPSEKISKRSLKRKKHETLQEQKKLKEELQTQQKALNYLSKWKHCKSEWKFEKLRQVWLQQHLLNTEKVPDDFWDIAIEYFKGAKGHSRQVVLDDAIKLVENDQKLDEIKSDKFKAKVKRAKDIICNLE